MIGLDGIGSPVGLYKSALSLPSPPVSPGLWTKVRSFETRSSQMQNVERAFASVIFDSNHHIASHRPTKL